MSVQNTIGLADDVRALLAATADGHPPTKVLLGELGPRRVVQTVLAELLDRAWFKGSANFPARVDVKFTFSWADETIGALVSVECDVAEFVLDPDGDTIPGAVVGQALDEVVLALYGPADSVRSATRTLRWTGSDLLEPGAGASPVFAIVQRLLAAMDRQNRPGLAELAVRHGSDKFGPHQYTRHYERHFAALRDRQLTVLEIGVGGYGDPTAGGGASLRMWRDYFPRAQVYGLDLWDNSSLNGPRIRTVRVDQAEYVEVAAVSAELGPFDIVIDDGSHVSELTLASFRAFFPHLRPGGVYVVEDVQTSYWPIFGGNGSDLNDPLTTMGFAKTLLDGLNHTELLDSHAHAGQPTDTEIDGIHFYRNLLVLEKGANTGQSPIADNLNAQLRATTPPA